MATSKTTKSDSPTAAEEQLAQASGEGTSDAPSLEDQAKEQKAEQRQELADGKKGVSKAERDMMALVKKAPAGARVGHEASTPTVMGKMDNMSRRSGADALEGHFVTIDRSFKGVDQAYLDAGLDRKAGGDQEEYRHPGVYGVYLQPAAINPETGIPETALVRLRDDTNKILTLPYEALSPAQAGGR